MTGVVPLVKAKDAGPTRAGVVPSGVNTPDVTLTLKRVRVLELELAT